MRVFELVPKWSKGMVCKTISRGFESHPVLFYMWTLAEWSNALDCGSRVHQFESGTPTYFWFVRLTARTTGFHPVNGSSTLLRTLFGELAQ